jgi:murein DD-endopeptidase MepM/ murein hydrolase activator NlpD
MTIELNEEQVLLIEKKLEELGLNYVPLQCEILDHVCCMTEDKMQNGKTFEQANQAIFENFGKDELKELQDQTILFTHRKSQRMKGFALAVFTLLLIPSTILFFSDKEKINGTNGIKPPSPQEMMTMENLLAGKNVIPIASNVNLHDPPSIKPIEGGFRVNSGFGRRIVPGVNKRKFHSGIDFKAPIGTPVLATADGEVIISKSNKTGYGKHIIIQHDEEFKTLYSHLSELKVEVGDKIKIGDVIGLVGSTGTSTGPHLHYEVIKDGKKVDPEEYFNP